MRKFTHISTWIQHCILYCIIPGIFIMRLLSWSNINSNRLSWLYHQLEEWPIEHNAEVLPLAGKCIFFIIESVPTIFLLIALRYFWNILELYKKSMHFSQEAVSLLKRVNIVILVWAIYQLFFDTIASLVVSLFRPAGQRYIMVSIDFDDILRFFAVFILLMVLHVVKEAHRIKSEQDLVV